MIKAYLFMPDEMYSCVITSENMLFVFNALYKANSKYFLIEYGDDRISIAKYSIGHSKLKNLDPYWDREQFEHITKRFLRQLKQSENFTQ